MYPTEMRDCPDLRLAAMMHRGAYARIGQAYEALGHVFTAQGLWPQAGAMVGVYYDSPAEVPEDQLRSAAGVIVGQDFQMPEGLTQVLLPGGDHLVLTLKGPYAGLPAAWEHLYSTALPNCGRRPRTIPPVEVYLNSPMDTAPDALLTEIRVPLA